MSTEWRTDSLGMGINVEILATENGECRAAFSIGGLDVLSVGMRARVPTATVYHGTYKSKDDLMKLAAVCLFAADRLTQMQLNDATDTNRSLVESRDE